MVHNPASRAFTLIRAAIVLGLFVAVFLLLTYSTAYAAGSGRIVVKFKNPADAVAPERSAPFVRELSLEHKFSLPEIGSAVFIVSEEKNVDSVLSAIRSRDDIVYAERDRIATAAFIPNDPCYAGDGCPGPSWYFPLTNFPLAWDFTFGAGVTIAVLDTGVNCTLADMAGQCVSGRNVVNSTNISSTVNSDDLGHGTFVASVAGAVGNNGIQITGAAFGAKIMPIKINQPGQNYAYYSDMANGVLWANDHGVRVVNISFCDTSGPTTTLQDAAATFRSNGGVVFECAGNQGAALTYADLASIITVGATDQNDALASFSNTGATIDLTAPGIPINAVAINGNLSSVTGTSFATPLAASVAALMISRNPALTASQIESIMESNAVDLGSAGKDNSFGWGRINAGASVLAAGSASDTTAPSAPTNLAGTPSSTQVSLTWTASTDNVGVTGYNVYRCTGSFCAPGTLIGSPGTNSYVDATVAAGTTYNYNVKAKDAAGNISSASNKIRVTTTTSSDTTPPSTPTNLAATPSSTQVALSWTASTDNVGVTGYNVYRCTGTCTPTSQIATPSSNSYTDTGVTGATTYSYLVKAHDAAGNLSTASNTVTTTVPSGSGDTTAPSAPTNLAATPSSTQVALLWTASTDNVGVTGYNVYRCTGTCTPTSQIATPSSNSYTDTSVTGGTTYSYTVKSKDAAGNVSAASNTVTTTVPSGGGDTTPPSAPINLTAPNVTKTQVVLSWTASTDNVGVTGYAIYRCLGATCTPSTQIGTSATPSFTDATVAARKTYNYIVKAYDAAGNISMGSSKLKVTTPRK